MRKLSGRIRVALATLLLAAIVASLFLLPVQTVYRDLLNSIRHWGIWGAVCLGLLYIPACLLFLPSTLLTLGAGFVYGIVGGTVICSLGLTLGATTSFLVARTLARGWMEQKVGSNPNFVAIDQLVGRQGFKIVLLIRLSPLFPIDLTNYALGLTRIPLGQYVLATWLGKLPGGLVCVSIGSAAKSVSELAAGRLQIGVAAQVVFAMGLVVTIVAVIVLTQMARKALRTAIEEQMRGNAPAKPDGVGGSECIS
jgi:uncharacterized membrane protein YdjX (TVP38/TMEM64 family)